MDNIGKIIKTEIVDAMQRSYLDYAMSVIVARALPDVRDGLKPPRPFCHATNGTHAPQSLYQISQSGRRSIG